MTWDGGQYWDRTSDPYDVNSGVGAVLAEFCALLQKWYMSFSSNRSFPLPTRYVMYQGALRRSLTRKSESRCGELPWDQMDTCSPRCMLSKECKAFTRRFTLCDLQVRVRAGRQSLSDLHQLRCRAAVPHNPRAAFSP